MDLRKPILSVVPDVRGATLAVLARTYTPLTGNRIAMLAGDDASQSSVSRVLRQLVDAGLVLCQPAGSANLYSLNRDHLAAPAIEALALLRARLLDEIRSAVEAWAKPAAAVWLFGSVARGDATVTSDVDLCVITNDDVGDDDVWSVQFMELSQSVLSWTGNDCRILDFSREQLDRLIAHGDPLVRSLRADALHLSGARPSELLGWAPG